jgi:hypothetical protein
MKNLLLFLILYVPCVAFAELIQNNGPFYEYEDLYFNLNQEILIFSNDQESVQVNSLWDPISINYSVTRNAQKTLSKGIDHWEGTTLLLIDSCSGFLTHYFHFLEHLMGVWQFGGAERAYDVKRIIFCSQKDTKQKFFWKGVNQINEKLIRSLFPNAQVFTLAELKNWNPVNIYCDRVLISSRPTAYKIPACAMINKMLGASWQDITPSNIEKLRQTIFDSLHVTSLPKTQMPRITYIMRHPPRTLSAQLENTLIQEIKNKTGIKVRKVNFAALSFEKQLDVVANTDILIGVHGNGLSHIVFLPPSATVFEIFPPTGFTWDYALLAKIRGLNYYGQVATGWITSAEDPHHSPLTCHGNLNTPARVLDVDTIVNVIQESIRSNPEL